MAAGLGGGGEVAAARIVEFAGLFGAADPGLKWAARLTHPCFDVIRSHSTGGEALQEGPSVGQGLAGGRVD